MKRNDLHLSSADALDLANRRLRAGEFEAARELSLAVLAAGEPDARALYLLGTIAFENDDPDGAVQFLQRAIDADPGAVDCYEYLETVFKAMGRSAEAQDVAARAQKARIFNARYRKFPLGVQHYQRIVDSLHASRYMDFPQEIAIETMAACNAACVFCPYPGLERQGLKMPDALIEKIVRDLEDVPRDLPFTISPFKVNDPLLDVRIFDVMELCNERLPNAGLRLFTNGSPLTARHLGRLRRIRNLGHLWVSLNHHDPERYQQIMKIPWKRTIEKLDMVHRAKAAGEFDIPVFVSRVSDGSADDAAFLAFLRERFPLFRSAMVPQSQWLGQVEGLLATERLYPIGCGRWYELSITATGQVAFCCMDGKAEYPIGNVETSHVLEVYNYPAYRMYRERLASRMDAMPCRICTNL